MLGPSMKKRRTEFDIIHDSLDVIKRHFNCNYYFYGSYVYKTEIVHSDLNIYLDIST